MKNSKDVDIENFGNLNVLDAQGMGHTLAPFWLEQRAAMVFVRHFG